MSGSPIWRVNVWRTERDSFTCEADTADAAVERVKRQTVHLWHGSEDVRFTAEWVGETCPRGRHPEAL